MLAADTYPDYDGYTIYTTKGAAARPQPKWPDQDTKLTEEVRQALRLTRFEARIWLRV